MIEGYGTIDCRIILRVVLAGVTNPHSQITEISEITHCPSFTGCNCQSFGAFSERNNWNLASSIRADSLMLETKPIKRQVGRH